MAGVEQFSLGKRGKFILASVPFFLFFIFSLLINQVNVCMILVQTYIHNNNLSFLIHIGIHTQ